MSAEFLIANLLRIAKGDLQDARALAPSGSRNAIYLLEQSAEKVILAVLTSEGKRGNIKHLLHEMVDLVPDENPLKPMLRAIEDLGIFATAYRYPTTVGRIKPAPAIAEFEKHATCVERALTAAIAGFRVDPAASNAPAGTAKPIRAT